MPDLCSALFTLEQLPSAAHFSKLSRPVLNTNNEEIKNKKKTKTADEIYFKLSIEF
jgi:hypothetical protein